MPLRVGFIGAGRIADLHALYYLRQKARAAAAHLEPRELASVAWASSAALSERAEAAVVVGPPRRAKKVEISERSA